MLDKILATDEGVARYRTLALGLLAFLITWAENKWGTGVVGELSDIVGLSESTITMGVAYILGGVLYTVAQRWPALDPWVHLGAKGSPSYIDVESREV